MNCSYRILKDIHIGVGVRKTSGKGTVPFKNDPITNAKLVKWSDQGFQLRHPDLPRDIWVDFWQLPLDKLDLVNGVIKNPITFVEEIRHNGRMVFLRADSLDYMEMLHDKQIKEETPKYAVKDLTPGDRVISCLCKDGNVMVYLGTFGIATLKQQNNYSYGYRSYTAKYSCIAETPERAFFAYEQPDGKYQINAYPLTNKTVLEVYRCDDKGSHRVDEGFINVESNLDIIKNKMYTSRYSYYVKLDESLQEEAKKLYSNIQVSIKYNDYPIYIQIGKDNLRKNAFNYLKDSEDLVGYDKSRLYETEEEFRNAYGQRR